MAATQAPILEGKAARIAAIDYVVAMQRLLSVYPEDFDEERSRRIAELTCERGRAPQGAARQLVAALTAPDREPRLRSLALPCLVIHGEDDPMIPIQGGERTHACIPNSQFFRIPRMGHYIPRRLFDPISLRMRTFLADAEAALDPAQAR